MVAEANRMLYQLGSDDVEAINAICGERCSPHPHNFTDRIIRPGNQAFFDIIQSYTGYRTCYYRTFNVGRATPRSATRIRRRANGWTARWRGQARSEQRRRRRGCPRRRSSASRASSPLSACSSRMGWASRCTSGRSSAG